MKKIKIVDAIMGSGKTHDAIDRMKKHKGNFVYVTPFLDEVDRIIKEVPGVHDPKVTYEYDVVEEEYVTIYKRDNLLINANKGINMATTHSLFKKLSRSDYKHFVEYDLILDEVITPIQVLDLTPDDIHMAFNDGLLVENERTHEVTFTRDDYKGKFNELKRYCKVANVIYVEERLLVWSFPPEIFRNFRSVNVMTYLFEGSLLAAYFRYYDIPYEVQSMTDKAEQDKKNQIRNLLNIYEGPANKVGELQNDFSLNWLKKRSSDDLKRIKTSAANILERRFNSTSDKTGFTTFKAVKSKLKGKGFSKGFISVNERATNKYCHKESMIYFANRFLNPRIIDFFRSGNIKVDVEQWALAELIQWIWRGSIRKDEPMNLYIPSKRMRDLLKNWLEEDSDSLSNAA